MKKRIPARSGPVNPGGQAQAKSESEKAIEAPCNSTGSEAEIQGEKEGEASGGTGGA
jgi:hypothetical protein